MYKGILLFLAMSGLAQWLPASQAQPARINDPYGILAHVSRPTDWPQALEIFKLLDEININWIRTDFEWSASELEPGRWDFSRFDRLMKLVKENDHITILPILNYDVTWASPAWKHLDEWTFYVRQMITRYGDTLRYWEVYNEPNLSRFWRGTPSGSEYASLLKRTYAEIKSIDPEITVLYAGLSGVPIAYIEESFKAGAADSFDVMNIHPYHWRRTPEKMIGQLRSLRALMERYGVGDKPVWITETGWSTAQWHLDKRIMEAAFSRIDIDVGATPLTIIHDPEVLDPWGLPHYGGMAGDLGFESEVAVRLADIRHLDIRKHPVLLPTYEETFPASWLPDLVDYVRRGGTLLLVGGVPFYYDINPSGEQVRVDDRYVGDFRIGWDAWWKNSAIPRRETAHRPAPGFEGQFNYRMNRPMGRTLHARHLKGADEFIPVIESVHDDFRGTVMGIYKFNSDFSGNIVVLMDRGRDTVSQTLQAEMLPRTYLVALANGIDRIFWYNFRSRGRVATEREEHFGIVESNLAPKPAYHAYGTLTRMCPSGSTKPVLKVDGDVYKASWVRPDKKQVWAVWTTLTTPLEVELKTSGTLEQAVNHLGEAVDTAGRTQTLSGSVLYLIGPDEVGVVVR